MENNGIVPYTDPTFPEALASLAAAIRRIADAVRQLAEVIAKSLRPVIRTAGEMIDAWADERLRAVATGKEWHLMKHARKARTRKKYRNLLLRRWLALLAAGVEEEDDAAA